MLLRTRAPEPDGVCNPIRQRCSPHRTTVADGVANPVRQIEPRPADGFLPNGQAPHLQEKAGFLSHSFFFVLYTDYEYKMDKILKKEILCEKKLDRRILNG
ncbi:MAG: hypothetical protein DRI57_04120 [Deltaproteobacteria bacterium]|nr:MAG: hypothetical protein DRI57_04120 [Deltaproteobacteria bacterium]